ncbi:MAG TPA: glycoside hydrolase family 2 TIM barrel-domain containing protein [Caldilineaceae bacterium]|nr:glycoside hydrolase family 2 TIM barrel-domain containing protein [Caldilineaceae bacterium]
MQVLADARVRTRLDLSGRWRYQLDPDRQGEANGFPAAGYDRASWQEMELPKNWYLTEVGDYFGVVWFSRTFRLPAELRDRHITLRFNAVDYYADVWLNGEYLGHHAGYFTPFEFDVTDFANPEGDNVLVVKVDAPRDPTEYVLVEQSWNLTTPMSTPYKRHWAKDLTLIKGHHIDAMHRPGAMTKFRADGNSGGIWQPVEIIGRGVVQAQQVKIYPKLVVEDGSALIAVDLTLNNSTDSLVETQVRMTVRAKNFEDSQVYEHQKTVQLQPGLNIVKLVKTIPQPKLWWTWDHGRPNLYQAEFQIGADPAYDALTQTFGVKTIEQDQKGNWLLNGRRIFLRGMRYLSSLWISEMDEARYREDLEKMRQLNINAIRLGSHVELPAFYDLCDEMGFLLWQVFPMHYCYSDSDDLIEQAAPMMRQMVEMLYNHACIGMWSVFKEPKVYGLPNRPNNYGRLCQIMYEAAKTADPIRWVHRGDYEEGVKNIMIGYVMPGDVDIKKMKMEPNIVEFGCGALPCRETLTSFIPADKLWPPDWDTWEYYCLFYNITFNFSKISMGNSLDEFIENSQRYAARNIKEQAEYVRQRKYQPMGSMYLYFWNDPFPGIGSGLLDYYRRPYRSYEVFQQIYTPVLVSLEWNKDPYYVGWQKVYHPGDTFVGKVWITNDHLEPIYNVQLAWRLLRADGDVIQQAQRQIALPADSSKITDHIVWPIPAGTQGLYRVEMCLTGQDGATLSSNDFEFMVE